ncbi:GrpB family protein [Peribacillus sp. NPDC097198]|uniref:GrpB family protein n=1 Tax=Peribacillus sp. NPDC097198 TaxID=3364397 RepID=UPI00381B37DE
MRKVEVVSHQEKWPHMFQDECEKLLKIFVNDILNIHHIGSTAIPTIHAKPVIDMVVEVKWLNRVDEYNADMDRIGYEAMGEYGIAHRRFFVKGGDKRTHHVHVFQRGNEEIIRHVRFRDYMIAHPEEAHKYSQLKKRLAKVFPNEMAEYIEGKNKYIQEIDKRAKKWANPPD